MALELVYTSAVRGLRSEGGGFCTVAMTRGMPPALVPRLESLSGYRPGPSGDGPVAHCFFRVESSSGTSNVLAAIGPAPPDHTARTNKIASFLVLGTDELAPAGPAWLLAQRGLLRAGWSGEPAWIERPVAVPSSDGPGLRPCAAWERACGDGGWAGAVASSFLRDQSRPIHVICGADTDALGLVDEVMSLLPPWARWRATFSTYFLQPVAGVPCSLRFCLEGTPAAEAGRAAKGLVVDVTRRCPPAPDSRFVRMARTGVAEPDHPDGPAPERPSPAAGGGLDFSGLGEQGARATSRRGADASARAQPAERQRSAGSPPAARAGARSGAQRAALIGGIAAAGIVGVVFAAWAIMLMGGEPQVDRPVVISAAPAPEPEEPATERTSPPQPRTEEPAPRPRRDAVLPSPAAPRVADAPAMPESAPAPPPVEPPQDPQPSAFALDHAAFGWKVDAATGDLVTPPRTVFAAPGPVASLAVDLGSPSGINIAMDRSKVTVSSTAGARPVALGDFTWSGTEVRWTWRRVVLRANEPALESLRGAFETASIEARLVDGRKLRYEVPAVSRTTSVDMGGSVRVHVPFPPGTEPVLVAGTAAGWDRAKSPPAGEVAFRGAGGELAFRWDPVAREAIVSWACEELNHRASAGVALAAAQAGFRDLRADADRARPAQQPAPGSAEAKAAQQREEALARSKAAVDAAERRVQELDAAIEARARSVAGPAEVEARTAAGRLLARVVAEPRRPAERNQR